MDVAEKVFLAVFLALGILLFYTLWNLVSFTNQMYLDSCKSFVEDVDTFNKNKYFLEHKDLYKDYTKTPEYKKCLSALNK